MDTFYSSVRLLMDTGLPLPFAGYAAVNMEHKDVV